MLFAIETTDQSFGYDRDKKPCDGAFCEKKVYENGYEVYNWFIEVNTAEELMQLVKNCKYPIILDFDSYNDNRPSIEIYDDYRE